MTLIRRAEPADAQAINQIREIVWPEDSKPDDYVAQIIRLNDHATHVAVESDVITGFVDGFATSAQDGTQRWEVDLLAVHPDFRKRGIAKELVAANTQAGREQGAVVARALTFIDNSPVFGTFTGCGYVRDEDTYALYVSTVPHITPGDLPSSLHVIPVTTLTYKGGWLAGSVTPEALALGRSALGEKEWDLVGVVFSTSQHDLIEAAKTEHYRLTGYYYWWTKSL